MIVEMEKGTPKLKESVFIAPSAVVVGDVEIGEDSSVWFNATVRGDVMPIRIGKKSNIQDGSVLHGTYKKCGTTIGDSVTVGHGVLLHGCTIGDRCLIGMGSVIMDKAIIASDTLIAAGSLVKEGSQFPAKVLVMGRPAVVKRELNEEELKFLGQSAENYIEYKKWYKNMEVRS
jgi:carbonic anhydrase/acetyltransferase-like protein (isoleucine patch superfamily)